MNATPIFAMYNNLMKATKTIDENGYIKYSAFTKKFALSFVKKFYSDSTAYRAFNSLIAMGYIMPTSRNGYYVLTAS